MKPLTFNRTTKGVEAVDKMEWISVKDRLPKSSREVEVAFWDGCCMCRTFGGYEDGVWYVGQDELEDHEFKVTHWKDPTPSRPHPTINRRRSDGYSN